MEASVRSQHKTLRTLMKSELTPPCSPSIKLIRTHCKKELRPIGIKYGGRLRPNHFYSSFRWASVEANRPSCLEGTKERKEHLKGYHY